MQQLETFRSMAAQLPATKFGVLLAILPDIERLRAQGHSSRAIWESLRADGVDLSYDLYRLYLRRARRRRAEPVRPPVVAARADAGERRAAGGADPFANVRSARGVQSREHFRYDPLAPVKEDLLR